jgi:uncharacterized protein YutE (UPF0331/DUF86 family)
MQRSFQASQLPSLLATRGKFVVHLYGEIDDKYVYEFMKKDLKDISDFKSVVAGKYLAPKSGKQTE